MCGAAGLVMVVSDQYVMDTLMGNGAGKMVVTLNCWLYEQLKVCHGYVMQSFTLRLKGFLMQQHLEDHGLVDRVSTQRPHTRAHTHTHTTSNDITAKVRGI